MDFNTLHTTTANLLIFSLAVSVTLTLMELQYVITFISYYASQLGLKSV